MAPRREGQAAWLVKYEFPNGEVRAFYTGRTRPPEDIDDMEAWEAELEGVMNAIAEEEYPESGEPHMLSFEWRVPHRMTQRVYPMSRFGREATRRRRR